MIGGLEIWGNKKAHKQQLMVLVAHKRMGFAPAQVVNARKRLAPFATRNNLMAK